MEENIVDQLPEKPGVYLMKNITGKVLYIGKAKNLRARVRQYFSGHDMRSMIPILTKQIDAIETIITFTEKEALLLENTLIKKHKPKYNILLKDDKTHLSILINTQHKWPMIKMIRTKESSKEKGVLFGPYTSALAARKTFELISKVFPLRQCSDRELASRKRPCILHSMGKCLAPCIGKCTKQEYDELVALSIEFLQGKSKEILQTLQKDLKKASNLLEYEKAHTILKTIHQIEETLQQKSTVIQFDAKDCDALNFIRKESYILLVKLAFRKGRLIASEHYDFNHLLSSNEETLSSFLLQHYQNTSPPLEILLPIEILDKPLIEESIKATLLTPERGEKKALVDLALENAKALFEQERHDVNSNEEILLHLQEVLKLHHFPSRIECFDTSSSSGKEFVASLVVFINGVKDPKQYRLYKIKSPDVKDDTAAMREVLYRRLRSARSEQTLPDLIIVDGGKGQLTQLMEVTRQLEIASIDLAALTKEASRHDKGLTKERIFRPHCKEPIEFSRHSSLIFFLQQIRDEAHRRALSYYRKTRQKRTTESILDTIPGIGPVKKKALLNSFGSIKKITEATPEELLNTPGISKKDIENLKNSL